MEAYEVVNLLKSKQLKCTFAESLTGGMIASSIVNISGASDVFEGSIVSYSDRIKHEILGVSEDVLSEFSAVSEECARQMAEGARKITGADIAISVTGIAGPTGAMEGKPVGTVFMGVSTSVRSEVYRFQFDGDRDAVRNQTRDMAITKIAEATSWI